MRGQTYSFVQIVVYLDQPLSAAHSKQCSKSTFSNFTRFCAKMKKMRQKGIFWAYSQMMLDTKMMVQYLRKLVETCLKIQTGKNTYKRVSHSITKIMQKEQIYCLNQFYEITFCIKKNSGVLDQHLGIRQKYAHFS